MRERDAILTMIRKVRSPVGSVTESALPPPSPGSIFCETHCAAPRATRRKSTYLISQCRGSEEIGPPTAWRRWEWSISICIGTYSTTELRAHGDNVIFEVGEQALTLRRDVLWVGSHGPDVFDEKHAARMSSINGRLMSWSEQSLLLCRLM
jgi:hypothetical protein